MHKFFPHAQDPVSCGTHSIGAAAAFAGGVLYLFRAIQAGAPTQALAAAMCFCFSMIALYSASAIYHYYPGDTNSGGVKRRLRWADLRFAEPRSFPERERVYSFRVYEKNQKYTRGLRTSGLRGRFKSPVDTFLKRK